MAVNTELAKKVFVQISLHPETHDQTVVTDGVDQMENGNLCGTTACVAGWTLGFTGYLEERVSPYDPEMVFLEVPRGQDLDWFQLAKQELGIPGWIADALFSEERSEEDAREILRRLAVDGGSTRLAEAYLAHALGVRPPSWLRDA